MNPVSKLMGWLCDIIHLPNLNWVLYKSRKAVRELALDETKRGIDCAASLGCETMTLWMGQDGLDYSFQADFSQMWDHTIAAMQELADHNRSINLSIEYKPNEPRAFSLMPDVPRHCCTWRNK